MLRSPARLVLALAAAQQQLLQLQHAAAVLVGGDEASFAAQELQATLFDKDENYDAMMRDMYDDFDEIEEDLTNDLGFSVPHGAPTRFSDV